MSSGASTQARTRATAAAVRPLPVGGTPRARMGRAPTVVDELVMPLEVLGGGVVNVHDLSTQGLALARLVPTDAVVVHKDGLHVRRQLFHEHLARRSPSQRAPSQAGRGQRPHPRERWRAGAVVPCRPPSWCSPVQRRRRPAPHRARCAAAAVRAGIGCAPRGGGGCVCSARPLPPRPR